MGDGSAVDEEEGADVAEGLDSSDDDGDEANMQPAAEKDAAAVATEHNARKSALEQALDALSPAPPGDTPPGVDATMGGAAPTGVDPVPANTVFTLPQSIFKFRGPVTLSEPLCHL
jgi:hypothetical protein